MRTVAIWTLGLIASSIIGGGIGSLISYSSGAVMGMVAGPCAFACARLWLAELREISN
jgi:hypothetical protein